VSAGELKRALAAGVPAAKIVFSGVGKTKAEMAFALDAGLYQFNVESEGELAALDEVARARATRAPVALRINPDVDAKTHAKISTGKAENKFGIPLKDARAIYALTATVAGGAPRHTNSMTAGGARHATSHSSAALTVMATPPTTLAAATTATAAHQPATHCVREKDFHMACVLFRL
jgi:diaminopimelate decarboxylase